MINENEMQISNMSYTDRDFASIYPELLELTKKLTNKWDPSISNESDPGNVLLKLAAAIGDKSNYNIDKNVLECFMPSATQETSMRRLTEAVGYNMKYYQSAMTDISFKYTGEMTSNITFGRFGTVISNSDNSVAYTLIEDVVLAYQNIAVSGLAIEGLLESLMVSDSEVIKLENLTDNNRLYFPEIYVAENGVFITNDGVVNFDEWTRVDNLNTQQPLTRCYKFGYDSAEELPYIEFPSDIAQLIGSGIRVSYIVTTGANGNVSAGALSELRSATDTTIDTSNLIIFNPSSATNGKDKETIDEAYNNFKKIIGTFETLVTTRDYANAMYNLRDEYNNPLVSNAQAADRTDDINYALSIVSYDNNGQYVELIPSKDMTVSDLSLYPLKPYKGENFNIYRPEYVYEESFKPLKVLSSDGTYTDDKVLVSELEDLKCIGHTFMDMSGDVDNRTVYGFKNIATLDIQIFTYAKVNSIAQADIRNNVIKALSDNFNARMVDYGYELPYDKILDVIYAADSRIKSVSLAEPQYTPHVMYVDGEQEDLNNTDLGEDIIAKNVLSGRLSLFTYDGRFEWRFGQTEDQLYDNLESITTSLTIPVASDNLSYIVDKNEVIQLIAPSLSTETIYPSGVYYRFISGSSSSTDIIIPANSDYMLLPSEQLIFYYVDSEEQTKLITLGEGTIIKPSFNMYYTNNVDAVNYITISYNNVDTNFVKIETNQSIETRKFVSVDLKNINTPIYWIRNNEGNILFEENETDVLLDSNEYFIYSNSNLDDLVILGSGTYLKRTGTDLSQWNISNTISLENINLNGLNAFTSSDWQYKQFTENNFLTIQEMQIITLGANSTLNISNWSGHPSELNGTFVPCSGEIEYVYNDTVEKLPSLFNIGTWNIRTRLDIDAGPNNSQELIANSVKTQKITLKPLGKEPVEIVGAEQDKFLMFNYPIAIAGGSKVDLLLVNVLSGDSSYTLSANVYINKEVTSTDVGDRIDPANNINIALDEDKTITLPMYIEYIETQEPSQGAQNAGLSSNYEYYPFGTYIVPLLFTKDDSSGTKITLSSNCADLYLYNEYDSSDEKVKVSTIDKSGLYMIEMVAKWQGEYESLAKLQEERPDATYNEDGDICKVTGVGLYEWYINSWALLPNTSPDNYKLVIEADVDESQSIESFLTVGKINKILDLNGAINVNGASLLEKIRSLTKDTGVQFYYIYTPDNADVIEADDLLSAEAFWDVNNVANKFTLPEIDFINSRVYIARSSQL